MFVPLFNDGCGSPPSLQTKLLAIAVICKYSKTNPDVMHIYSINHCKIIKHSKRLCGSKFSSKMKHLKKLCGSIHVYLTKATGDENELFYMVGAL